MQIDTQRALLWHHSYYGFCVPGCSCCRFGGVMQKLNKFCANDLSWAWLRKCRHNHKELVCACVCVWECLHGCECVAHGHSCMHKIIRQYYNRHTTMEPRFGSHFSHVRTLICRYYTKWRPGTVSNPLMVEVPSTVHISVYGFWVQERL